MKSNLNSIYQELLLLHQDTNPPIKPLFEAMLQNLSREEGVLSSIWKASIKTMIKLLSYPEIVQHLIGHSDNQATYLDSNILVQIFLEAKIDPVDQSEEEQKLLLKQKMLLKIVETFHSTLTEASILTIFRYILSVVKKKTLED